VRYPGHPGYEISQWIRKRVEEGFGWMNTIGGCAAPAIAGANGCRCYPVAAGYNLIRIANAQPGSPHEATVLTRTPTRTADKAAAG
jgi:hypothetical protein